MKKLDVKHFLGIYQLRQRMQENGVTNPSPEIKDFTKEFVMKLSELPLDEEIKIKDHSFFDAKGNLIATIPLTEQNRTKQNFDFFKTEMPKTRKADYNLGCLEGSVFIDFNRSSDNSIFLIRISFDGYGCCNLDEKAKSLNEFDSKKFILEMGKENLNQESIERLVKKTIKLNKDLIWTDAIEEYGLIEKD